VTTPSLVCVATESTEKAYGLADWMGRTPGVRLAETQLLAEEMESVTLPAKPFSPPRIMLEVARTPADTVTWLGLATMLKSTILIIMDIERTLEPLEPVMTTR